MNEIINQIILGIESGSIYALIALGYTMVYGIIRLINFAHGDFIMVACYMIYTFFFLSKMDLVLAIVLSMLITVLLGILTERIAYRPLRKKKSPRQDGFTAEFYKTSNEATTTSIYKVCQKNP